MKPMNNVLRDLVQSYDSNPVLEASIELTNARRLFNSASVQVYGFSEWFGIDEEGPLGSFNLNLVLDRIDKKFCVLIGAADGWDSFDEAESLSDMDKDPVDWLAEIKAAAKNNAGQFEWDNLNTYVADYPEDFQKLIGQIKWFHCYLNMSLDELEALQKQRDEKDSPF